MRRLRDLSVLALAAGLTSTGACSRHAHDPSASEMASAPRQTPSGLPIPRYVSLKFGVVNARGGPGDDYKLDWVYRVKGLPLQVVAETEEWRRVCGPDGAIAWVHKRTVAEKRTVMRTDPSDLTLRKRPTDDAEASAILVGHALAELKSCANGWCRLQVGHAGGWARDNAVWGASDRPQCHAS
jgi:SH3-like domain-containing protein